MCVALVKEAQRVWGKNNTHLLITKLGNWRVGEEEISTHIHFLMLITLFIYSYASHHDTHTPYYTPYDHTLVLHEGRVKGGVILY